MSPQIVRREFEHELINSQMLLRPDVPASAEFSLLVGLHEHVARALAESLVLAHRCPTVFSDGETEVRMPHALLLLVDERRPWSDAQIASMAHEFLLRHEQQEPAEVYLVVRVGDMLLNDVLGGLSNVVLHHPEIHEPGNVLPSDGHWKACRRIILTLGRDHAEALGHLSSKELINADEYRRDAHPGGDRHSPRAAAGGGSADGGESVAPVGVPATY